MDTKLKNINYTKRTKQLAFALAVLFLSLFTTTVFGVFSKDITSEGILESDYIESDALYDDMESAYAIGRQMINHYKSVDFIKLGKTISIEEFEHEKRRLYQKIFVNDFNVTPDYEQGKATFERKNSMEIQKLRNSMIQKDLDTFYNMKSILDNTEGLLYYISNGTNTYSNTSYSSRGSFVTLLSAYYVFDEFGLDVSMDSKRVNQVTDEALPSDTQVYIGFSNSYLDSASAIWQNGGIALICALISCAIYLIIALICIGYSAIATGQEYRGDILHMRRIDGFYTDFYLILMAGIIFVTVLGFSELSYIPSFKFLFVPFIAYPLNEEWLIFAFVLFLSLISFTILGVLFLSLVRSIKNKSVFKRFFLIILFKKILTLFKSLWRFFLSIFDGSHLSKYKFQKAMFLNQVIFLIAESILVILTFVAVFAIGFDASVIFILLGVAGIYQYATSNTKIFNDMGKIMAQIDEIRDGNLSAVTDISEKSGLYEGSKALSKIGLGLKESVDKAMASERMKVDLVTNMSHDLKTPLTSIIAYVDLLAKEEGLPDQVKDYVTVLTQKSNRLKVMIQDLFDLSKATSGNIEVEMERLDFCKLIEQILADLSEPITDSRLDFRLQLPKEPVFIQSDGKKMYRIFENLIANALKYSLMGTRVYVSLQVTKEGNALASIKNTSNYEMDFDDSEVLERFVRGDKVRSTEGSGLGLSIVQSYVIACGGIFNIQKNADLFIAEVIFSVA